MKLALSFISATSWEIIHYLIQSKSIEIMPNRTLDQIIISAIYLAIKLLNLETTFVELVMTLNNNSVSGINQPDLMTHIILELSDHDKYTFYNKFEKTEKTAETLDKTVITGTLPEFYNKIFIPVLQEWIAEYRSDAINQQKYNSLFPSEFQKAQTVLLLSPKTVRLPNRKSPKNSHHRPYTNTTQISSNFITPPAGSTTSSQQKQLSVHFRGSQSTIKESDQKKINLTFQSMFSSPDNNNKSSYKNSIIFSPTRHSRVDTKTKLKQLNEFVQESFSKKKRLKFD